MFSMAEFTGSDTNEQFGVRNCVHTICTPPVVLKTKGKHASLQILGRRKGLEQQVADWVLDKITW